MYANSAKRLAVYKQAREDLQNFITIRVGDGETQANLEGAAQALAKAGARFTDAYAGFPVCSPSRAARSTFSASKPSLSDDLLAENGGGQPSRGATSSSLTPSKR